MRPIVPCGVSESSVRQRTLASATVCPPFVPLIGALITRTQQRLDGESLVSRAGSGLRTWMLFAP